MDNVTAPAIPERLRRLPEIATDLWWTWNAQPRDLFRRLDYPLWRQTAHNPVLMLTLVSQDVLNAAASDERFLSVYDAAVDALDAARAAKDTWWQRRYPEAQGPIAYFSAEFALHQSLPIYAGGLGVLAGDHCKEASDLGIPLIGVGFMYPQGYFHQSVSPEGWQQESVRTPLVGPGAGGTRADARRQAVHHRRAAGESQRARVGVARPARPRSAFSARHGSRRERPLGPRTVGASIRRRPRNACPAGDHPGYRRRAGAQGHGLYPGCLASQRGTRGVRGAAANSRPDRTRRVVRVRARRKCVGRRSSPRTRRYLPATTRSPSTWSRRISPTRGGRSANTATPSWRSGNTTTAAVRCST